MVVLTGIGHNQRRVLAWLKALLHSILLVLGFLPRSGSQTDLLAGLGQTAERPQREGKVPAPAPRISILAQIHK